MRCVASCGSTSFPWLVFFFGALLWGSMNHKHTGRWTYERSALSYLGAERNTPVIPNWFQLCQCCCCLCYPEEYLRLGILISYNWAQVLEACDSLKLLSIFFDLCVDWHWSPYCRLWRLCQDAQLVLLVVLPPAKPSMSSAKWRLVIVLPPVLTVLSWSFKASVMILSRNILKRVGEGRHPCRTPTVVINQSPMLLLLKRTALVALSQRFWWLG